MDSTEESLRELLDKLDLQPLEDTHYQWTQDSIGPLPTISLTGSTMGGTLHPTYGAVPNVTIGSMNSAVGINVSAPIWTTTSTGTGGYTIHNPNIQPNGDKVHIAGEDADLVIGKKSMRDWMEKVEERLNILTPNPDLEKEWDDLRKLGERYRKLEKKCKEKADMWKKLKSMPKPEIK